MWVVWLLPTKLYGLFLDLPIIVSIDIIQVNKTYYLIVNCLFDTKKLDICYIQYHNEMVIDQVPL